MTYIVAGQIADSKFLMADCIATNQTNGGEATHYFAEKVKKLLSDPNIFFTLAGKSYVAQLIENYDYWLYSQGTQLNFLEESNIKSLVKFLEFANERNPEGKQKLGDNRLFFLSKDGVYHCELNYGNGNILHDEVRVVQVPNMHSVDSSLINFGVWSNANRISPNDTQTDEDSLRNYCIQQLNKLASFDSDRGRLFIKVNRFQFILINSSGNAIINPAFKHASDMVAAFFALPYRQIDNKDFRFEL